ncbi:hypothetical protein NDU88_009276 [Pleurodeles waltl]|uniref:Uncharacterized protein n=1 Tax=Pleurodeles waltl TaxID=8319 RepID=A0AAV7QR73_PLEWA|nr:hypothetical protein NDU88_009276 [Pleurodeles waltl]
MHRSRHPHGTFCLTRLLTREPWQRTPPTLEEEEAVPALWAFLGPTRPSQAAVPGTRTLAVTSDWDDRLLSPKPAVSQAAQIEGARGTSHPGSCPCNPAQTIYHGGDKATKLLAWLDKRDEERMWVREIVDNDVVTRVSNDAIAEAFVIYYVGVYDSETHMSGED